jgi:hypothetical protein
VQQHQQICLPRRLSGVVLCGIACLLAFSAAAFGQTVSNPSKEEPVCSLVVGNELIAFQIEIVDKAGTPITNLKAADFLIWEDGVKQTPDHIKEQKVIIAGKERTWYRVGYYSTNDKLDGTFRVIRIDVQEREGRELSGSYWPNGYFAKRF